MRPEMALVTVRLTRAEVAQMLDYLHDRDYGRESGWYFGNKEQFEKRHASIRECLERALGKTTNDDRETAAK
jgi:hypothetical protein